MTAVTAEQLRIEATCPGVDADKLLRQAADEIERLREALRFYANPEVYKPHPHGPAFDNRDLSFHARAALEDGT